MQDTHFGVNIHLFTQDFQILGFEKTKQKKQVFENSAALDDFFDCGQRSFP